MPDLPRSVVNGELASKLTITDRGLHYGDGVFRTILMQKDKLLDENLQFEILQRDASRLSLNCPPPYEWKKSLTLLRFDSAYSVIKCILTRGSSSRGYAIPELQTQPSWIVSLYEAPRYPESCWQEGVACIITGQRWGMQPVLAGIKHLNRLEQVLGRTEVELTGGVCHEGLMCDQAGNLISGCMSNLFIIRNGMLVTPRLNNCGVAGMMREKIINTANHLGMDVTEKDINVDELWHAEEVFLCNSLIGIWPVRNIQDQHWKAGAMTRLLQEKIDHPRLIA